MEQNRLKSIAEKIIDIVSLRPLLSYFIFSVSAGFVLIQFCLPSNYVLPRTYIGTEAVGLQSRTALKSQLITKTKKIKLSFDNSIQEYPTGEVGISTDINATLDRLPTITIADRLIPLKPLYMLIKKETVKPVLTRDKAAIQLFARTASQRLNKEPANAQAEIKDGQLVLIRETKGVAFAPPAIEDTLLQASPLSDKPIEVRSQAVPAKVSEQDLLPLKQEFSQKTTQALKVQYGTTSKVVDAAAIKSLLTIVQNPQTGKWSLALDPKKVDDQVQAWAKEYNVAPGITQVTYYDDVETARKPGAPGRVLNTDAVKTQLNQWLSAPTADPVVLASSVVAPRVVATRTYSRSSAQLQAKLNAWIAAHHGHYQVAIRELSGRNREASYNVAQQTVMASTYKPFLAFVAYRQAETGALDLSTPIVNGRNVEQCIEVMIVVSDNDCGVSLGQYIGWAKVDEIIAAAGFPGTRLNNYNQNGSINGDKLVNAQQQASFLAQLSGGSLINPADTGKLLSYMKRQIYRNGIPAGSRGATVANKVGFLDAYIHDVGIVYGSKSTYALVIMSDGSNWANIKDLSQAIYDFMNE